MSFFMKECLTSLTLNLRENMSDSNFKFEFLFLGHNFPITPDLVLILSEFSLNLNLIPSLENTSSLKCTSEPKLSQILSEPTHSPIPKSTHSHSPEYTPNSSLVPPLSSILHKSTPLAPSRCIK